MARRALLAVLLLGVPAAPVVPLLIRLRSRTSWAAWAEVDRLVELAATTVGLAGLTLLFVLPVGIGLAIILDRTDLPGRGWLRGLLVAAMFVPLPLFALAWQAVGGGWRPWTQGVLPAAFVHAMAALPWVVWLTGLGLSRVEPDLEEDARMVLPAAAVLWRVSLRQAAPAVGLAAVWVVLQTAGEITVTDLGLVRTFAEEVYTQFVTGSLDAQGQAVAVALPGTIGAILAVGMLTRLWAGGLVLSASARPPLIFPLGRWRRPAFVGVSLLVAAYAGVPLVGLLVQAGGGENWSAHRLAVELRRAVALNVPMILDTLAWATAAGVIAAGVALVASWAALDSRVVRGLLFVVAVALWAIPGPVLGFGLKQAIDWLMDLEEAVLAWTAVRPIRAMLYDQPSPLPVLWAHVARLFPYAVAIVWPAVREVPRDLRETARVDGASVWGEFRRVTWPATRRSAEIAALAVTALALGELAVSKIVQVPGRSTFAQELFAQMHYAATATTAALALVQLALAGGLWLLLRVVWRRSPPR